MIPSATPTGREISHIHISTENFGGNGWTIWNETGLYSN
jgi:hypothetical protein